MEEKAAIKIINDWGALGAVLVIGLLLATTIVWILFKEVQRRDKRQRDDFIEMRNLARGAIFKAEEDARQTVERNTRVLERIEIILTKLLTDKL